MDSGSGDWDCNCVCRNRTINTKTKVGCVLGLIVILVSFPLSFYMSWLIMNKIQATELMWFVFWVNWPLTIIMATSTKLVEIFLVDDKK